MTTEQREALTRLHQCDGNELSSGWADHLDCPEIRADVIAVAELALAEHGANMVPTTTPEFKAKWGERGTFDFGHWWIDHDGCIRINPANVSHYEQADKILTAVGCKPPDPRDAVFKAYGWKTCDLNAYWLLGTWEVNRQTGRINNNIPCGITITTAAQAEALCVLMGLTKVGV